MFVLTGAKGQHDENCKLYVWNIYSLFYGRSSNDTNGILVSHGKFPSLSASI